jgi:hypothetical protein
MDILNFNQKNKKMKVTLNIENDAELRAYIKDTIKGQVLSIVREEFLEIVKEELERKLKGTDRQSFTNMTRDCMKQAISDILYKEHSVGGWNKDFIAPIVSEIVKGYIKNKDDKDWDKMVDDLAKEKVKSLLK